MRLKTREIADYRSKTVEAQGHLCQLCQQPLEASEAVLDHDHKTGYIRGSLHRGCNALLGKIENSLVINKITPEKLQGILANLVSYQSQHHDVLHPTHLTPEERKARTKRRAKLRKSRALK